LTEYVDWKTGPESKEHQCQDCHMPDEKAQLAEGSPFRAGVPHHGLLGLADDLRKRALGLEVTVSKADDKLAVAIVLANNNAGHAVPAGLPERRIVVTARLVDAKGSVVASDVRTLGRKLVDASGVEVPFWKATKVASDTRIAVGGQWTETIQLPVAATGAVEVIAMYRGMSDDIARQLSLTEEAEEHEMVRAIVKLGGTLPKTTRVKPPPPGKGKRIQKKKERVEPD
jgi:hypothetical protein